jgi:hypothetical protein
MADRKVLTGARLPVPDLKPIPTPTRAAEAATGGALTGVLPPELTRIVCTYERRPRHRFDTETAPAEQVTVSADGRSFVTIAQYLTTGRFVVWSRYTLHDGAQRWSMRLPANRPCWIGVGDVRTRSVQAPPRVSDAVYAAIGATNRWRSRPL